MNSHKDIHACLQDGVDWDDIECMLEMDIGMKDELREQDQETGLYPLMMLALDTSPYDVNVVFKLLCSDPLLLFGN